MNLDEGDIADIRKRGLAFLRAGQPARCLDLFEMLEALGDVNAAVSLVLASCHDALGHHADALLFFHRGLAHADSEGELALHAQAMHWGRHLLLESTEGGAL